MYHSTSRLQQLPSLALATTPAHRTPFSCSYYQSLSKTACVFLLFLPRCSLRPVPILFSRMTQPVARKAVTKAHRRSILSAEDSKLKGPKFLFTSRKKRGSEVRTRALRIVYVSAELNLFFRRHSASPNDLVWWGQQEHPLRELTFVCVSDNLED